MLYYTIADECIDGKNGLIIRVIGRDGMVCYNRGMKTRKFGKSGREVSEVGIGTWQLGGTEWGDVPEEQALEVLYAAAGEDVTFIDTADIYGGGRSEKLIAKFLATQVDPSRYFVATKFGRRDDPGWPGNFEADTIKQHTEDSLRRLGIGCLDLTQAHCLPYEVMSEGKIWDALRGLKEQGMIHNFGASVESMDEALMCLNVDGLSSLQIIFNIFRQKPIEVLFEKAKAKNVAIIVRLPLASGALSGKFKQDTVFPETDHRNFNKDGDAFNVGETFAGLPFSKAVDLAAKLKIIKPQGMTLAQTAIKWCLEFDAVTTVIPGAKRAQQAKDNARTSRMAGLNEYTMKSLEGFYEGEVVDHIRGPY